MSAFGYRAAAAPWGQLPPTRKEPVLLKLKFQLNIEGNIVDSEDFESLEASTEAQVKDLGMLTSKLVTPRAL